MKEPWDAVFWWELRRIPFNLALLVVGMVSVVSFSAAGSLLVGKLVAPALLVVGVVAYAIAANAFYTLGWVSELLWSGGATSKTAGYRRRTFYVGLAGSVALTLVPALAFGLVGVLMHHR